tara:strand:+ start:492 stop:2198 length:1707 start_codon:yes stop_codon:yes gene_type:complete
MINIILSSFAGSLIMMGYGLMFNQVFFKKNSKNFNYFETGILSFIFVGFLSLIINFFIPINKIIGSIFLWTSLIYFFIYFMNTKKKIELFYIIIILSFISSSILILSNINRPDAGLYHLPYVSILNENKIIIGLTNIHYRFGHTSVMQYISAIFNNHTFKDEFINVPLASIFSFYLLFVLREFKRSLENKENRLIISNFLIIVFSIYSFSRYSNYGNDIPSHLYFFILIIFFLKIPNLKEVSNYSFYRISLISIFLFMLKPFMIIALLLPVLLFIMNQRKLKLIKDTKAILCSSLIIVWVIKNILISGCLFFPIKQSCITDLKYYDKDIVSLASNEAEAWAKGFPDQKGKNKIKLEEYNSNLNWIPTWRDNHFKKIQEKVLPFLIFIFIVVAPYILIKSRKNKKINKKESDSNFFLITMFSLICCMYWFFYFPVYRFGISFIAIFIIAIFVSIFFQFRSLDKVNPIFFWSLIIVFFLGSIGKNYSRIFNNYNKLYISYPWPKIYTLKDNEKNIKKKFKAIHDENNQFLYNYSGGEECMYSKSPCTHMLNNKVHKSNILGYDMFYLKSD